MLHSDLDANSPPPDVLLQCIQLTYLLLFDLRYGMRVCKDLDGVAMRGRCGYDLGSEVQGGTGLTMDSPSTSDRYLNFDIHNSNFTFSTCDLDSDIIVVLISEQPSIIEG